VMKVTYKIMQEIFLAFDIRTGHIIWKVSTGGGPTMGLVYDSRIIYASTASNASIVAVNAADGKIIWESQMLGDPKVGYSIDAPPIIWKDYVIAGSGGSGLPPGLG
jgi:alcohol dehydrogenase (cytochrome c)